MSQESKILNIYQRINAVMKDCEYLQKKDAQMGKGIRYDEVVAMIRVHMIKHGIVVVIRQSELTTVGGLDGKNQKIYQGCYEMDLVNIDDSSDRCTHSSYAQGMDGGDKGAGKAQTYAVKQMLVKGFMLETGIDEESRSEKIDNAEALLLVTAEQVAALSEACRESKIEMAALCKVAGVNQISNLYANRYEMCINWIKKQGEKNDNS